MKIVFLDRKTIGDDLDLTKFEDFGQVVQKLPHAHLQPTHPARRPTHTQYDIDPMK